MKTILRLVGFEFELVRILFFRVVFERMINTVMAAFAGFGAVFYASFASRGIYVIEPTAENFSKLQGMVFFAFLYAETVLANWQYTTNKTGRMELIFNSTQPPLRIIFAKNLASACFTLASMVALYALPFFWFGLGGTFNMAFWLTALPTLFICTAIMSFNAVFEFLLKQIKAVTAMLNLVLPFVAMRNARFLPSGFDFVPYFSEARFLYLTDQYGWGDVAWMYFTTAVTGLVVLALAQAVVRRIRSTASVYLE